jgi:hypothetical protein
MITSLRGELRLKLGQSELAQTDFQETIALAQRTRVKASRLPKACGASGVISRRDRWPTTSNSALQAFSFLEGASLPEDLAARAARSEQSRNLQWS